MDADIKWLVGDMRIGASGFRNGQPWEIGLTIGVCMDGTAELQRIDKPLKPSSWRAIGRCLARFGFTHYRFERKLDDGTSYWHERGLERYHHELRKLALEAENRKCTMGPVVPGPGSCPHCGGGLKPSKPEHDSH